MVKDGGERLVLLVGLEAGQWGFELRSIQEFFAAGYLTDTAVDNRQRFDRFQAIALSPHWHNVALFFAGRVGRTVSGEAASLLEACRELDRHKPEFFTRRGAWLAVDIAVDRSFGPDRPLQRSAIEYGLTLLDHIMDADRWSELLSKLNQLPPDDISHHVIPLLTTKLTKEHSERLFKTMRAAVSLTKSTRDIDPVFEEVLNQGDIDRRELCDEALKLRVNPSLAARVMKDIDIDVNAAIADRIADTFTVDSAYVLRVLACLPEGITIALRVFDRELTRRALVSRRPKRVPDLRARNISSVFDELQLATELVGISQSTIGRGEQWIEMTADELDWLCELISTESLSNAVRAAALGVLLKWLTVSVRRVTCI